MRYRALLIGNSHFPADPANLPELKGPLHDVAHLARALADPLNGLFPAEAIIALTGRASAEIAGAMHGFFAAATREDVLLLYYSGHGLSTGRDEVLLCGRDSRTDQPVTTTVGSSLINRLIADCAAASVIVVLDCCHSGPFTGGDLATPLSGRGRYVLSASRPREGAPDVDEHARPSRFTGHLIRGLAAAPAAGGDGLTVDDLYRYVHARMTATGPVIPQRRFDGHGDALIARRRPAATPAAVLDGGFVSALLRLLRDAGPGKPYFVSPDIPETKLGNARAAHGLPESETILAMVDFTAFGSAKNSALFTGTGFWYRNLGTRFLLAYEHFRDTTFATRFGPWAQIEVTRPDLDAVIMTAYVDDRTAQKIFDLLHGVKDLVDGHWPRSG